MTTIVKLLERKQKLLELLQANPGPNERDEIEGQLAQIDTALDMLEEPGENSEEQ
jgi:predicted CopG family antitoxin